MKTKKLYCICSNLCIFRENVNTILRLFRIHLLCRTKFFDRAHHSVTWNSTEFSFLNLNSTGNSLSRLMSACNTSAVQNNRYFVTFFYIRCTCYDLNGFCSDIYLTDNQLVSIRMLLDLINLSDYDLVQICIHLFKSFYFCSGQCHCIGIFLCCHVKIRNICFYP